MLALPRGRQPEWVRPVQWYCRKVNNKGIEVAAKGSDAGGARSRETRRAHGFPR